MKIRLIEEKDLPVCRKLRNDNRHWFYDCGPVSEERHRAWYNHVKDKHEFYVIEEDGKVIGTISSKKVGLSAYEIGNLTLDEEYRGRGLMTEAVKLMMNTYFDYYATTLPENVKSQAVFLRAGFYNVGTNEDGQVILKCPAAPEGR